MVVVRFPTQPTTIYQKVTLKLIPCRQTQTRIFTPNHPIIAVRSLLLLPFLLLFFLPTISAQDGLFPAFDIRARLLGGTGLTGEGIDALWTNPAGLAHTGDELEGAAFAEQRFGLSELTTANIGAAYKTGLGGFGLQLASFGFDSYRETRIGLAYGRKLSEKFSIGADFSGFAVSTEGYESTFNLTFGLGMQLEIIPELHVGARIFSPLRIERFPDEYLPQLLALGLSYQPSNKVILSAEIHQDAENPARFRGGLEYLPAEELSIRLGVATENTELSFGLGYEVIDRLELSAGAVWHEVLGVWPGVGLRWR
ncbi:hypothetical protein SAMN05444359_1137 [Neolewinella agarilytica]|uniref:PorV/PorQ family protein n=1 Tax=Neolewinella agarilytica TaxID=478744 RepID=A0A1H9HM79_9BACT|nr:hypothetical protein SAMN05444359_1137 [Neolewinella agarilytica]